MVQGPYSPWKSVGPYHRVRGASSSATFNEAKNFLYDSGLRREDLFRRRTEGNVRIFST